MDFLVLALAVMGVSLVVAAWQSWRGREDRRDVALLAVTGAGLGLSAVVVAA